MLKKIPPYTWDQMPKTEQQINLMASGASTDINNLTEQTKEKTEVGWTVCKTVQCTGVTRLVRSKEVDHTVAFTTIEEEEVPVWSVSLGERLKGKTHGHRDERSNTFLIEGHIVANLHSFEVFIEKLQFMKYDNTKFKFTSNQATSQKGNSEL